MSTADRVSRMSCCSCPLSRRHFLAGCAAGAATLATWKAEGAEAPPAAKPRVRLVFTHVPSTGPIWPNIGYDFDRRKKELTERLTQGCPNVEFVTSTAMNAKEAQQLIAGDKDIDGYLVYMVGLWSGAPRAFAATGKPTLYVDDLYAGSGEFLIGYATARRARQKVAAVSSSRLDDVIEAARLFEILKRPNGTADAFVAACDAARKKGTKPMGDMKCPEDPIKAVDVDACLAKLRTSTILAVGGGWGMPGSGKSIEGLFGTKVVPIEFKEVHAAYEAASRDEARKWAETWTQAAERVIEPTPQDIENSGAMYVAMLDVLKRHNAQGIAINCLGGFYSGQIRAFPCLGFCQLNNDGLVGACEGDLTSSITMLAFGGLVGRPGFISDPVMDTSKNQIIYAHCVAPTKVFGPQGPSNPYHIRSHSEDRKGASMRSLMPLGYMTTTLEIHTAQKEVLFHQGKTVENIDEDKACRTKLAAEVKGDIDKLFGEWDRWGWHRVTFYGDLRAPVEALCKAIGMRVIEEA